MRYTLPFALALAAPAGAAEPPRTPERVVFDTILDRHRDLSFDQFRARLGPDRAYLAKPSADPTTADHFDAVRRKLELTPDEVARFRKTGFVSLDLDRRYSFASAYY